MKPYRRDLARTGRTCCRLPNPHPKCCADCPNGEGPCPMPVAIDQAFEDNAELLARLARLD